MFGNENASGNQEWEQFVISADPACDASTSCVPFGGAGDRPPRRRLTHSRDNWHPSLPRKLELELTVCTALILWREKADDNRCTLHSLGHRIVDVCALPRGGAQGGQQ